MIVVILIFEGSIKHTGVLEQKIDVLIWPDRRPVLLFESWGEPPHDDPMASL